MKRQRGMVLLPVTLALAVVGTLAYVMTRDGVMNVTMVDTQYDIERARYLAEAGVNLLRWRNEQLGCGAAKGFSGPITALDGGTITSSGVTYKKPLLAMTVTATTPRGAVNQVVFDDKTGPAIHNIGKKVEVTLGGKSPADTFLRNGSLIVSDSLTYLETTEGSAHGLIKFDLTSVPATATVTEATLRLYLGSIQSTQAGSLGVHRMLRAWPFFLMSWNSGWTNPGGDFAPVTSGTMTGVLAPGWYTAPVDGLVQTWNSRPATNLGLLLKPTGLVTARFNSFDAATNQPQLFLRYYPICS